MAQSTCSETSTQSGEESLFGGGAKIITTMVIVLRFATWHQNQKVSPQSHRTLECEQDDKLLQLLKYRLPEFVWLCSPAQRQASSLVKQANLVLVPR